MGGKRKYSNRESALIQRILNNPYAAVIWLDADGEMHLASGMREGDRLIVLHEAPPDPAKGGDRGKIGVYATGYPNIRVVAAKLHVVLADLFKARDGIPGTEKAGEDAGEVAGEVGQFEFRQEAPTATVEAGEHPGPGGRGDDGLEGGGAAVPGPEGPPAGWEDLRAAPADAVRTPRPEPPDRPAGEGGGVPG